MVDAQQLCVVEDTFFIRGRGLVVMTTQWRSGQLRPGDWLELRSTAGDSHLAQVKSIEMVRFTPRRERTVNAENPGGLLLMGIDRDVVKKGDEVWSVVMPPPAEAAFVAPAAPRKPWWQRLFKGAAF